MPNPALQRLSLWPALRAAAAALLALGLVAGPAGAEPSLKLAETGDKTANVNAPSTAAAVTGTSIPKPVISETEAAYAASLDKAIAPVNAYAISDDEATTVREAVKAIAAANLGKGLEIRAKVKDKVAAKLVDWYRLRAGYGEPQEFKDFLAANPGWPDRTLMTQRMEEAYFTQGGSASTIKAHFKTAPPKTGIGLAALASAELATGNEAEARRLAARAWRDLGVPATLETGFLARFGKLLTAEDHKWRLDKLIVDDLRWSGDRNARASFVRRLIPLLPPAEQKKANARLAVFLQSNGAKAALEALPAEAKPDWGLVYHRAQVLRRAGRLSEAAKLILSAPTDEASIVVPDSWWEERRANAYLALKAGKPKLAYDLVAEAGPLTANPLKEQRFMAGWIALRLLKDAGAAEKQFLAMKKAADGPLSRAKANYWLGRTAEAKGNGSAAQTFYRAATEDSDTFHGLLAQQKLKPGRQAFPIKPPAAPSADLVQRFNDHDAVKAAVVARKAQLDASILRLFLVQLRNVFDGEPGNALVAHLAQSLGDMQSAVRTGKAAIADRENLLYYAYPVTPFPAYSALRKPPETAFLLGIARQETEFNTLTVSGAGAKGLLQVMTVTAKHVCADYKIKCEIPRLLSDPAYNAMVASAYIGDRIDDFRGSYVLALAGYNAGPGRARQWISENGDPRDPKVDPIDWIERIPIQETREYVAKVLANIQVYRARLGDGAALRLEEDIARARSGNGTEAERATAKSDG